MPDGYCQSTSTNRFAAVRNSLSVNPAKLKSNPCSLARPT